MCKGPGVAACFVYWRDRKKANAAEAERSRGRRGQPLLRHLGACKVWQGLWVLFLTQQEPLRNQSFRSQQETEVFGSILQVTLAAVWTVA